MKYDIIVAGGGMAGLTAAAFAAKAGHSVLLCEKEGRVGGLVGSFPYKGFTFDWGMRAMENSGVLFPMLRALDLNVDFIKSPVSIGVGDAVATLASPDSLRGYRDMLVSRFPEDEAAVDAFIGVVKTAMAYMRVLYGIDNPLFLDLKREKEYLKKTLIPWMFKYITTVGKIKRLNTPVEAYLGAFIKNRALVDVIAQHFFRGTPAFFALSYFSLYLDYSYPRGGTGALTAALEGYILAHGGEIRAQAAITRIDPGTKTVADGGGREDGYGRLIWCADQKALYAALTGADALGKSAVRRISGREAFIRDKQGGDSVLTLYVLCDMGKEYFAGIHAPHFFYTPDTRGLSALSARQITTASERSGAQREAVFAWLAEYLALTTYEISIPAMRDATLAPPGKTGLIVSSLMDYDLVSHIREMGWYNDFKALCRDKILQTLIRSMYPELDGRIMESFVSTPLTILARTGNTGGAITGWAFTNSAMPAVTSIPAIARAVRTPIPGVLQAGQWSYSPSGLPTSILTGKLAADRAVKELRRQGR